MLYNLPILFRVMASNSFLAPLYILFNVVAALSIVFANKAVFAVYRFPYPVYLTVIHTAFTTVGTHFMATVRVDLLSAGCPAPVRM